MNSDLYQTVHNCQETRLILKDLCYHKISLHILTYTVVIGAIAAVAVVITPKKICYVLFSQQPKLYILKCQFTSLDL